MGKLYTIGHSLHSAARFIELLKRHGVDHVLDVRSVPYSRYAPQFNRENIEAALRMNGIEYSFMGKFFGARPKEPELYCAEGYLDFERVRDTERFRKGLESVSRGLEQRSGIALMCTERDPIDCHRAIMVARGFELAGIEAAHILEDGSLQRQRELNERLLNRYFPNRDQLDIFALMGSGAAQAKEADPLREAYRLRNREIGYRPRTESDGGESDARIHNGLYAKDGGTVF